MSQEYQNEKSPILNGQKKPKTLGKVQKMTVLQAWEIYKMFANTRYTNRIKSTLVCNNFTEIKAFKRFK